jgi:serine/threonine-protein kinase
MGTKLRSATRERGSKGSARAWTLDAKLLPARARVDHGVRIAARSIIMIATAGLCVGDVVLERAVSHDAMGAVWVGRHRALQRDVVVRLASMYADHDGDADAGVLLAHEGRAMARIRSQHVPQVLDQGTATDGTPFVVMELVVGMDLVAWVRQHGRLDVEQAARLLDQVGDALASAHEEGIVHGCVAPENIVLNGDAETFDVKLKAFGLSRRGASNIGVVRGELDGVAGAMAGFVSPEQARYGERIDERADIWSLGAVMYWCLTGNRPFAGDTENAVVAAVERGHFLPVSEARPELSIELDAWFDRALAADPERRFQSVALMTKLFHVANLGPLEPPRAPMTSTPPLVLALTEHLPPRGPRGISERVGRAGAAALAVGVLVLGVGAAARWNSLNPILPHAVASSPALAALPEKAADPGWSVVEPDVRKVEVILSLDDASAPTAASKAGPAARPLPGTHAHARRPERSRSTTAPGGDWSPTDELGEPGERRASH